MSARVGRTHRVCAPATRSRRSDRFEICLLSQHHPCRPSLTGRWGVSQEVETVVPAAHQDVPGVVVPRRCSFSNPLGGGASTLGAVDRLEQGSVTAWGVPSCSESREPAGPRRAQVGHTGTSADRASAVAVVLALIAPTAAAVGVSDPGHLSVLLAFVVLAGSLLVGPVIAWGARAWITGNDVDQVVDLGSDIATSGRARLAQRRGHGGLRCHIRRDRSAVGDHVERCARRRTRYGCAADRNGGCRRSADPDHLRAAHDGGGVPCGDGLGRDGPPSRRTCGRSRRCARALVGTWRRPYRDAWRPRRGRCAARRPSGPRRRLGSLDCL